MAFTKNGKTMQRDLCYKLFKQIKQ